VRANQITKPKPSAAPSTPGEVRGGGQPISQDPLPGPQTRPGHNSLGFVLHDLGKLKEPPSIPRGLKLDPAFAQAHHNLGNALRETGDLAEAVAPLPTAIAFNPKFAPLTTDSDGRS